MSHSDSEISFHFILTFHHSPRDISLYSNYRIPPLQQFVLLSGPTFSVAHPPFIHNKLYYSPLLQTLLPLRQALCLLLSYGFCCSCVGRTSKTKCFFLHIGSPILHCLHTAFTSHLTFRLTITP
ncbi:hypothetical protein BLNAU_16627 [Blattamonas nauphoetae]|uniref:Uncharacterized protein n=1 Tax=Blattamonas nauphoetae TaxID=2049346 RepID=A0ABQ9XCT8_9EUKA|nr:hypothetical protein BLNAU_16627 [Blattamonas nauphoetae]